MGYIRWSIEVERPKSFSEMVEGRGKEGSVMSSTSSERG